MSAPLLEGVHLRGPWLRREFLPFDEIAGLADGVATLRDGARRRLPPSALADAERALAVPEPAARAAADAAAFTAYLHGAWSPERAALRLLDMASAVGATDIHFEPGPRSTGVRFRLSGTLVPFADLEPAVAARLTAALKFVSGCLPYRRDIVQEGRVPRDGVAADVRASFLPTALGERVALRLFGRLVALDELGFPAAVLGQLRAALDARSGLLLVAGPSGGGKTTTVYGALAHLAQRRAGAHVSIEDPVEQRLRAAGIPVDQVELDPARGLDAEAALAACLRQDLDVIGLAEVRTVGDATLALRAAHTGRLVLAGIHAGSPAEARQRMLDLGADGKVLDASLVLVLHQQLETRPCSPCTGAGCPRCQGAGVTRAPVAATASGGRPA
jgi:type II secretory ATPase GspE/PulE/Tfp pilus assembly ATPase PilB-like protein